MQINLNLTLLRFKKIYSLLTSFYLLKVFLKFRIFASVEHLSLLSDDLRTIVDVGANRGQFTLACRNWAKNSNIIAFEPLANPAKKFSALFGNDQRVKLHVAAVGPALKRAIMHVSAKDDSSSLLPIGHHQTLNFPGTHEASLTEIDIAPLNSFLSKDEIISPALLKLDVQGFEMQALEGCLTLLDNFDFVYCECSFIELYTGQKLAGDVIKWLSNLNFLLYGIYNVSYGADDQPIQADFLFKKSA